MLIIKESLNEDTKKKRNGKWVNKGEDGEHGEFATKKEADAQRKAMFANGYHESLNTTHTSNLYTISELESNMIGNVPQKDLDRDLKMFDRIKRLLHSKDPVVFIDLEDTYNPDYYVTYFDDIKQIHELNVFELNNSYIVKEISPVGTTFIYFKDEKSAEDYLSKMDSMFEIIDTGEEPQKDFLKANLTTLADGLKR